MKVLFVTSHITHPSSPTFMRNQTGFGYMVFDMAKHISQTNQVDMFVANTFSLSVQLEGVNIIKRTWMSYFCGLTLNSLLNGFKYVKKYKLPLKRSFRELYMYTSLSQLHSNLMEYDVVHIHGCSEITDSMIRMCKIANVPFVVTLHGLNSFVDSIKLPFSLKRYERDFLKEASSNGYPVSFISTGNKKTAESFIGHDVANFYVICNGCDVVEKGSTQNIREKYHIYEDEFLFVFVGNISKNKNQIQAARAWLKMPEEYRNRSKILFVGRYFETDEVAKFIKIHNLQDKLILCGIQPKEDIFNYYETCNATILTSLTEGFGLSIIEGYVYGKPNVTFKDLPAVEDLYVNDAMIAVEERTDEALAKAMVEIMCKIIDCENIKSVSKGFSFQRMTQQYVELYKSVIK